uniref:NADH-ubiquinone oxidoreductase chain 4 n=1 Tax=Gyrinicola batrachiensis TaxID=3029840 RepID=A0AB39A5G6_9BILA
MLALVDFFFLSLYFFFNKIFFCYFIVMFIFYYLNSISWSGLYFFFDSSVYLVLVFMSVFILGLICLSEKKIMLVMLTQLLIIVCLFFFISMNMFMLYIMFELSIFPILIMILGYGSQIEKINASYYLVFYAVFCSSPFLYVYFTSSYNLFFAYFNLVLSWEMVFFLSLCFLVKFPVYFLHLWLPKAHVEAPTTASMLLAGLLLKLGTGGYLRVMAVYNNVYLLSWVIISFLGMIMGSFLCIFQSDSKSVAAYSSIVHMSFVFFSLLILCKVTKLGGVLMMISHGYVSTLMFYLIGEFFHQSGTRMMSYLSGFMMSSMMLFYMMVLVFLCNGGVPPSMSFFSEFMGLTGMFLLYKSFFALLFFYFFVSFYFSIYILSCSMMGSSMNNFLYWVFGYMLPGVILMFNFFWLSLLC